MLGGAIAAEVEQHLDADRKVLTGIRYPHQDELGSTLVVTGVGQPAKAYYEPFGALVGPDGRTAASIPGMRHDFTGHERDGALINMKGRLYDPALRRFISPDPVIVDPESSQDYSGYAYVRNRPLRLTDPTGHRTSTPIELPPERVRVTADRWPDPPEVYKFRFETLDMQILQLRYEALRGEKWDGWIASDHWLPPNVELPKEAREARDKGTLISTGLILGGAGGVVGNKVRSWAATQLMKRYGPRIVAAATAMQYGQEGIRTDCVRCAVNFALRLEGITRSARLAILSKIPIPADRISAAKQLGVKFTEGSFSNITEALKPGQHALVLGERASGFGHAFNIIRMQNGVLKFVDTQSRSAIKIDEYVGFQYVIFK